MLREVTAAPLLDPQTGLLILAGVVMAVAIIWTAVGAVFFAYWPMRHPERLAEHTIYHYVKVAHLQAAGGEVTVEARRGWHVFRMLSFRRVTMAYFYVGRNGRGGRLNHSAKPKAEFVRVLITGKDFVKQLSGRPVYMRWWDRAIAVPHSYVGPAQTTIVASPRLDRRLLADTT